MSLSDGGLVYTDVLRVRGQGGLARAWQVGAMLGKIPAASLWPGQPVLGQCDANDLSYGWRGRGKLCEGLPLQSNVVWDSRRYISPATSPSPWLLLGKGLSALFLGFLLGLTVTFSCRKCGGYGSCHLQKRRPWPERYHLCSVLQGRI